MGRRANLAIDVHVEDGASCDVVARDVREGLTGDPRSLPSKYFYDERGSRLFERITELPEYYLTRAERGLLDRHSERIAELTRCEELVELGSGSSKKTRLLIEAALARGTLRRYIPFEVSQEIVEATARRLADQYPRLQVHAVVGDFERHMDYVPPGSRRLFVLLGSTLGNFPDREAVAFLTRIREVMDGGDWLLLGVDLVKEVARLEAAYNDSQGVTAAFNRNILEVVNAHVDADFDPDAFEHVAIWDARASRIESSLRSTRDQTVRLRRLGLTVEFAAGERLHTEVSCKYTRESVGQILDRAGLRLEHWFASDDPAFALSLSRRDPAGVG